MRHNNRQMNLTLLETTTIETVLEDIYDDVFNGVTPFEYLAAWEQEIIVAFNTALAVGSSTIPVAVV